MQICVDTRLSTPSDRQKMRNEIVGRIIIASRYLLRTVFIINNALVMYRRAQDIRFDRELYAYLSISTRLIISKFTIHNSKNDYERITFERGKADLSLYRRSY